MVPMNKGDISVRSVIWVPFIEYYGMYPALIIVDYVHIKTAILWANLFISRLMNGSNLKLTAYILRKKLQEMLDSIMRETCL